MRKCPGEKEEHIPRHPYGESSPEMSEGDADRMREWVQSEPETEAKERPLISHVFFLGLKNNSSHCVCVCVYVCVCVCVWM